MTAIHPLPTMEPPRLITWTQNAAILAVCAVLVSTALASISFLFFLILFVCVCATGARSALDFKNFPKGVGIAFGVYFSWQLIGLTYTQAPLGYALETIYSDRKILFILPLVLLFSDERPKKRFLKVFYILAVVGLALSYALKTPLLQELISASPMKPLRSSAPLAPENVFRSYATQSMVFAIGAFLSLWFASRQSRTVQGAGLYLLGAAFVLNLATLTHGRSGYVALLVFVVWSFVIWRGAKGLIIGGFAALAVATSAFMLSSAVHDRVMVGITEARGFANAPHETSLGRRMVMYQTTLEMIRAKPVLGLGTGGFKQAFNSIAAEKYTGWRASPADDPHNQYLFILAEHGVIGLLAFLALIGMMLKCCMKGNSIYGKMAAGCLLAWCATSLFSGHFRTFPEGHLIAFVVGILMVNRPASNSSKQLS